MAAKNDYILTDLQIITSVTRARDTKRAELKVIKAKFAEEIGPLEEEVGALTDKLSRLRGDGWVRLSDIQAGNVPGVVATDDAGTPAAPTTNGSNGTPVSAVLRHTIETVVRTTPTSLTATPATSAATPAKVAAKAKPIPAPRALPALGTTAKLKAARLAASAAPATAPKAKAAPKPKATAPAKPAAPAPAAAPATAASSGQEAEILEVIKANGPIATKEIAAKLDVEARSIRRAIGSLRTSGQIVAQGEGRAVQFTAA